MNLAKYRNQFRQKVIPSSYSGKKHLCIFAFLEIAGLLATGSFIDWRWWSVLVILLGLFQASVLTYFIHRYLLHKKMPAFHWAFKLHHWHHTFYVPQLMAYDEINDVYMLLMPPWLQMVYFVIYLPIATYVLTLIFSTELTLHFIFSLILWYGLYETIHWIEHLPSHHLLMRSKVLRKLRSHHLVHHSALKDEANFGIVEPSMDYVFRTKQ
jgi:sterol desaturase/sphingolipid hydroxylase (fatty acid hydroxylase superfamily)